MPPSFKRWLLGNQTITNTAPPANQPLSLDRLVQLLDTGASPAVRQAAAKQIANIATKCLRTDSGIEGDINSIKPDATTSQERLEDWSEVISVAAKVVLILSPLICLIWSL